jgi:hypothetical protein
VRSFLSAFPSWENQTRKEVITVKYEKPQITQVEDAGRAIQLMNKEVILPDAGTSTHLPPSAGVYEANE